MRRIFCVLLMIFVCAGCAYSETAPSQAGMDSAAAVVSMHDAVMRDVIGMEYSFANLSGAGDIYVLFSDSGEQNFLMAALDETGERVDTAVIQAYDKDAFAEFSLNSLRALYLPFCPEDGREEFEKWLSAAAYAAVTAADTGNDMETDFYHGDEAACGISAYHDGEKVLFTALIDWYEPLSAEDVNGMMTEGE